MKIKQLLAILIVIFTISQKSQSAEAIDPVGKITQEIEDPRIMLFKGATESNTDLVNNALQRGVDIDTKYNDGCTALIFAIYAPHKNMVAFLLNAKANPNIQNDREDTALIIASRYNMDHIVKLLLNANADTGIENNKGETALDTARQRDYHEIEKILRDEQAKQKQKVKEKVTENTSLVPDLADIVSEYVVCPKKPKKDTQKEEVL